MLKEDSVKEEAELSPEESRDFQQGYCEKKDPPDTSPLAKHEGFHWLFSDEFLEKEKDLPLILDIGAGMGRFLMAEAEKTPEARWIGVDPDYQCVKKNLTKLANRERRGVALEHVRFYYGSIYQFLLQCPAQSVDKAYINYPDPWFKRRHLKRRLVTQRLFDTLKAALKPGADIYVQTDIDDYAKNIDMELENLSSYQIKYQAHALFEGLTTTLYQEKAHRKNHSRHCYHLKFVEKS
ncbi:MAG: hypothetical protein HQL32_17215 [Planctomycetes bacterium]|nr:hypothetical protein [Planctomycetota bacterium]